MKISKEDRVFIDKKISLLREVGAFGFGIVLGNTLGLIGPRATDIAFIIGWAAVLIYVIFVEWNPSVDGSRYKHD